MHEPDVQLEPQGVAEAGSGELAPAEVLPQTVSRYESFAPAVAPVPIASPAPVSIPVAPSIAQPFQEPIARDVPAGSAVHPLLAMLVGAVLACLLVWFGMFLGVRHTGGTPVDPVAYLSGDEHLSHPENDNAIVRAVRLVGPAVMNVDTTFGRSENPDFLPEPGMGAEPLEGKGTGVVIDSRRGLMLTNAHVVAGAQTIQVTNRDGEKFTGKIRGTDRLSDIAVVELNNKNLPAAKLANLESAHDLAIGQWAIAIGNPFAQANTVTVGVVSAVGRSIEVPGGRNGQAFRLTDMVQTDAAINPGNSGGPLCNIRGEVIGINTAIIPFATGLGFSIPINKAMSVANQLILNGHVQHPYMGVQMQPISVDKQHQLGLPDTNGSLVQTVEPGSPADRAGIQPGDVIRGIDGLAMKSHEDVQHYVADKKVGDVIKMDILRNNTVKKTFTIKIGDRPAAAE